MPFKAALALALTVVLSAPMAFAAPTTDSATSTHASSSVHKAAKPGKTRPSSPKIAAANKRRHVIDTRPDVHPSIAMSRPVDSAPKMDSKKGADAKKADMKRPGKKREARRADAKKSPAKTGDNKQAVPVVAAALAVDLPSLPDAEPATSAPVITAPTPHPSLLSRAKKGHKPPCLHGSVHVLRGTEDEEVTLTKCDGSPAPSAAEKMSVLLRPGGTVAPAVSIDAGLIERLGVVTDHFAKAGTPSKVSVISGSRPSSAGSYHASGRAMDYRIEGVKNEDLIAFCKTLTDTGCGYYPNSSFVHMDVRDPGTGHVAWIDASGPGEVPRYVSQWPLPPGADDGHDKKDARAMIEDLLVTLEKELPPLTPKGDGKPDMAADAKPDAPQDVPAPKAEMERPLP